MLWHIRELVYIECKPYVTECPSFLISNSNKFKMVNSSRCFYHWSLWIVTKIPMWHTAIWGLPFFFTSALLGLMSFTFPPTSINLLFIPLYFIPLRFIPPSTLFFSAELRCSIQFPHLYVSLCCLTLRVGKKLKLCLSFAQFMQLFFSPFLTVGSIKNNDILGKYHIAFESELSGIIWPLQISLNPLKPWMAGSTSLTCNYKKHCGGTLTCPYFYQKITRNII